MLVLYMTKFQCFMFRFIVLLVLSTLILVIFVRLFQCLFQFSVQHNLNAHCSSTRTHLFYVLVYSTFYLLVCLFQCSAQHNLCVHQRAGTPRGFYSLPRLFSKLDSCRAFNSFISLSLRLIVLGLSSDRVSALSDFRHRLAKFAKQEDQYQNIVLYVESLSEKLYTSSFCGWVIFLDKIKISSFVGDLSRWLLQHKSERSASQCKNLMAAFYPEYPRY